MWTKVKSKGIGGDTRKKPAVRRNPGTARSAFLLLPEGFHEGSRCDIYSDGNGRLAFRVSDRGSYACRPPNKSSKARKVCIPAQFVSMIPFGTTDAHLSEDGGMLILDTAQFAKRVEAAE